jgi:simple sugar transport system permease protein
MAAGMLMALVFGFLVLTLQTNQVATGLALTLFGIGVSAFLGRSYVGQTVRCASGAVGPSAAMRVLLDCAGAAGGLDAGAYAAGPDHPRGGRIAAQRARHRLPGDRPALRHGAVRRRDGGLGGAYLSLALTPMWVEGMTAGRGWIALAQVVFATWKPRGVLVGAYLFGGVTVLQFHGQGMGLAIPSEFLSMLPYIATIVVLVLICRNPQTILLNKPMSLGQNFKPD